MSTARLELNSAKQTFCPGFGPFYEITCCRSVTVILEGLWNKFAKVVMENRHVNLPNTFLANVTRKSQACKSIILGTLRGIKIFSIQHETCAFFLNQRSGFINT